MNDYLDCFCNSPEHAWRPNRREFLFARLVVSLGLTIGRIIPHEAGSSTTLPTYVCIPRQPNHFAGPGYLGSAYGPFSLRADPASSGFKVRDLNLPGGVDEQRFAQRREMRAVVDAHFSALEKSDSLNGMDSFYQRAYAMISSDQARAAFDIK